LPYRLLSPVLLPIGARLLAKAAPPFFLTFGHLTPFDSFLSSGAHSSLSLRFGGPLYYTWDFIHVFESTDDLVFPPSQ